MNEITILHLSDIHFKKKKEEDNKTFRLEVQKQLIDCVKTHAEKQGQPDFVAVTGDIAFAGKAHEYKEALDFFDKLKTALPNEPQFLAVPGNHDVDRDQVHKIFSLHRIVSEGKTDDFLESKKDINTFIQVKFKTFQDFCRKLDSSLYPANDHYFQVENRTDKNVSFLGLNSCWACEGDNDRNNITLGFPQVREAFDKSTADNKVLLMHHPPFNWLNETDFSRYNSELYNGCGLILHGHTHADNALVFKSPSGSCICLGANASYTKNEKGFIGFQFIHVQFHNGGTMVRAWPYRLDTRDGFRFVPDRHRWQGQEGPYFELDAMEKPGKDEKKAVKPLEIPMKYREWVKEFHSTMDTDLLARKGEVITVSLPEVYIPIETRNPFYKEKIKKKDVVKEKFLHPGEPAVHGEEPGEPLTVDIEALVGRKQRILLRGRAGMGKTTLIKHLAYTITHGSSHPALRGYLPVLVFLKELWLIYREELREPGKKLEFEDLLRGYFAKSKCKLTMATVSRYLAHDRALFLLDGLDEVPDHLRDDLVELIARFQFAHKGNRFLMTGRPHGTAGRAAARFDGDLHDIEPLNDQMAADFIRKWFRAVSGRARGLGEITAEGMIADIQRHEHIPVFIKNPLLLTAVCILYQDGKRIPEQRADLYNRVIENLISRRFHDPAQPEKENEILEFLMGLAFDTHKKNRKIIDKDDALEILRETFPAKEGERETHYRRRILGLFNEIEPGCGLFNCLSGGEIEFSHLTFQEFLAAKYMVYMETDFSPFLAKEWWQESLLLYAGFMSIDRKRKGNDIVKEILARKFFLLGARALCDFQATKRDETVVQIARDGLIETIQSDAALDRRFQAGVLMGGLGDKRIKNLPMVKVEAGEFNMGSNKGDSDEKPVHRVYLDEFMIGKYPVTNEEYKAFIDDNGYNKKDSWSPDGWKWRSDKHITEPGYWRDREWNGPNFPVVGVSWYEAAAYAGWLSKKTGKTYRLPTEAQWEKAARGNDGREYPWGDKFDKKNCNSVECGLNRTSPVGVFPGGISPCGCLDMAGNVWEWCWDWFGEDYYKKSTLKNPQGPSRGSGRVVRGGCWFGVAPDCRAACRDVGHPAGRGGVVGFRLARSF